MKQRKYLSANEVEAMINVVPHGNYYFRDRCLILMCYIHGLRVSEISMLRISDIQDGKIFISRLKRGLSTTHPLQEREVEALNFWMGKRNSWLNNDSPWLFLSRHGKAISRQQVYELMKKYGKAANLSVNAHPHMLRHACGFALADHGKDTRLIQDYLGHRNIQHTVLYTASNAARFSSICI